MVSANVARCFKGTRASDFCPVRGNFVFIEGIGFVVRFVTHPGIRPKVGGRNLRWHLLFPACDVEKNKLPPRAPPSLPRRGFDSRSRSSQNPVVSVSTGQVRIIMMKRLLLNLLRWGAVTLSAAVFLVGARAWYAFRDRNPGYALDLKIDDAQSRANPRPLRVGFGRVQINPDLSDPKRPVWVAGFSHNRAATAIHDDLWAIACVLDDGYTRVGIVALDAIGFFHDDTVEVRNACPARWKLDYVTVCATHNHSTPDLMGLWGPNVLQTGVDEHYRRQVIAAAARALGFAVKALQPARVAFHEIPTPPDGLVA